MKRTASAARKSHAPDVYQIVTDRIAALLSAGVVPWRKGWTTTGVPRNLVSGKAYRGINIWLLSSAGFTSPYWLTYKQAQERGGNVRKGEKGTVAIFWKLFQRKDAGSNQPTTGQEAGRMLPFLRYYTVFNVEQCDGLTEVPTPEASGPEARALMRHCRVTIRGVATRTQITMKRVRQVRREGVTGYLMVCDWIEIISGNFCYADVAANPPKASRKEAA